MAFSKEAAGEATKTLDTRTLRIRPRPAAALGDGRRAGGPGISSRAFVKNTTVSISRCQSTTSGGALASGRGSSTHDRPTSTLKRKLEPTMNFLKRGFKAAKSAVGAIFGVRPSPLASATCLISSLVGDARAV